MPPYVESVLYPLECIIRKRQLAFWLKIENCDLLINKIFTKVNEYDLEYVTYYKQLKEKYGTPKQCDRSIQLEYVRKWKESIITSSNEDANSKLGTYYDVNPDCKSKHNATYINILELERITLTRYRTSSHNLKIETGRHSYPKIPREQRIYKCNEAVQTLHHILFDCNLLRDLWECRTYNTTEEFFKWDGAATYLLRATKVFKIEIWFDWLGLGGGGGGVEDM